MNITPTITPDVTFDQKFEKIIKEDAGKNPVRIAQRISESILKYGVDLQEVEQVLREKNCSSYLIARKRCSFHGKDLSIELPNGALKTYFLYISTQKRPMQEILQESSSYEDNFDKLKDTGFLVTNKQSSVLEKDTTREEHLKNLVAILNGEYKKE